MTLGTKWSWNITFSLLDNKQQKKDKITQYMQFIILIIINNIILNILGYRGHIRDSIQ